MRHRVDALFLAFPGRRRPQFNEVVALLCYNMSLVLSSGRVTLV